MHITCFAISKIDTFSAPGNAATKLFLLLSLSFVLLYFFFGNKDEQLSLSESEQLVSEHSHETNVLKIPLFI